MSSGVRWLLRVGACVLALSCVFHTEISNSFSILLGDSLDGLIQTSILQHWDNVFRGLELWNTTQYFYPWTNTLGYNDGYFLTGLLFSIARSFGSDPFAASEIASIALRAIGFFAFEAFAVNVLAFGFGWALLGAVLFTMANNIYLQSGHGQLLTISFAPLLGLLLWRGLQALKARTPYRALGWGSGAALLYGAWLLTGFYMAWFMTLFMALLVLAALAQEAVGPGVGWRAWRSVLSWPMIPVGVILIVAVLPFLRVYLPAVLQTGGHPFSAALAYAPAPLDFLHIGTQNLLFGGADGWVTQSVRHIADDNHELVIGFPPLIAALAVLGGMLVLLRPGRNPLLVRAVALATFASFVLLVRVGPFTLWYFVYHLFPGGSGVRVISRYALFLTFPVVLLAVDVLQRQAKSWPTWLIALLAVMLVAEEITLTNANASLDRAAELHILAAIPLPPPACRAFFVQTGPNRPGTGIAIIDSLYLHNVDAMMVAEILAMPTINGFSTFNPPDWNFASVEKPGYVFRVARYAHEHHIEPGLCGLDLARHIWTATPPLPLARLAPGTTIDFRKASDEAEPYLGPGFNEPDEKGRLMDTGEAELVFALAPPPAPGHDLELQIDAIGQSIRSGPLPPLTVEVNGQAVATWHPEPGLQTLKAFIPPRVAGADYQLSIRLRVIPPPTSLFVHAPKGSKRLGLTVQGLRILVGPASSF